MVRLLRIERAITWIAKTLTANRDGNPLPQGVLDVILPNVDIFGTQRIPEVQFLVVSGGLGNIELTHGPVPNGFYRQYLSMAYEHGDPIAGGRVLQGGRVVAIPTGFPFAAAKSDSGVLNQDPRVLRNFTVPPNGFAAVRIDAINPAAQLLARLLWIQFPVGEYARFIT